MVVSNIYKLTSICKTPAIRNCLAFILVLMTWPASAQGVPCGEREKFLTYLGQNHNEFPAVRSITASGRVLEVLISDDGTWSIILTAPNGVTCMALYGHAWEDVERTGPAS